jgi:hypothetical protein
MPVRKKGRNGNKTHGRNKLKCAAYRNERRGEKNQKRKLMKHLARHPGDVQALEALKGLG